MTAPQARPAGVGECVGSRRAGVILGVDERTIVRWADDGDLEVAYRTRGGHRRFRVAYLEALAKVDAETAGVSS